MLLRLDLADCMFDVSFNKLLIVRFLRYKKIQKNVSRHGVQLGTVALLRDVSICCVPL